MSNPPQMRGVKHRGGTVGEQAPEVDVASFADAAEPPAGAAGIFARREPSQLATRGGNERGWA